MQTCILKDPRKANTWYARVRYLDCDGKRRERKRTVTTRSLAKEALRDLVHSVERELNNRKTFRDLDRFFRKEYLIGAQIQDGRKIRGYKQNIKDIETKLTAALTYFGDADLRSITYEDVRKYKAQVESVPAPAKNGTSKPRTVATVNHYLKWVRRMFNVAVEQGWLDVNPFKRGQPLIAGALESERTRVLGVEEESRLLENCVGRRAHLAAIVIFAIETGCRKGEILNLTWSDVDVAHRVIRIKASNTKTERARLVPLTKRLQAALSPLLEVAPRASGKVFTTGEFQDSFNRACAKAALEGVRFHDLRHTAITRMLEKRIPQPLVMKISGHTTVKTFLRYVNQTPASVAEIADLLDSF